MKRQKLDHMESLNQIYLENRKLKEIDEIHEVC